MHFASESGKRFARILAVAASIMLVLGDSAIALTSSVSPAFAAPANSPTAIGISDQPPFRFPWDAQSSWYLTGITTSASALDFRPNGLVQLEVLAAAGGDVYYSGGQNQDLTVKIRHGATGWETWYVHLSSSLFGQDGTLEPIAVNQGQYLGDAASTGIEVQFVRNGAPETRDGKVLNGWQIHADCVGYSASQPCQAGYVQDLTTGQQKVPSTSPGLAQLVVSTNVQPPIGLLPKPVRLLDTRLAGVTFGPIGNEASRCISVPGQAGVPANAAGVLVNVTAVNHTTEGWLTLYPLGQPVPATSTLNFDRDESAIANGVRCST